MFCSFCGSQMFEGDSVCAACGRDNALEVNIPAVDEVAGAEQVAYEKVAPVLEEAPKVQTEDSLSCGITSLVWGVLSALMSFGGLFLAMSAEGAVAGIIMSVISKKKAKLAKAYAGTVGAALGKGADVAGTFGLIASIYVLVTYAIVITTLVFFYIFYFIILMIVALATSGV